MSIRFAGYVAVLSLAACSGGGSPTAPANIALVRAEQLWARTAPPAYQMTVVVGCFCPQELARPVIVSVRDGHVESRRYADTGLDVDPMFANSFPTVEGLFDVIEDAIAGHASTIDVVYDPGRGYPRSIQIDGSPGTADDETFYGVGNFVVR